MARPAAPAPALTPEAPERTAYAVDRKGGGWAIITYKLRGDRVVSQTESTPDIRAICQQRVMEALGHDN